MSPNLPRHQRVFAYSLGLILAFATALPAYITSTFLAERLGEARVGLVYAGAAIFTLGLLALGPWLLNHFKLQTLILTSGILASIAAFGLATGQKLGLIFAAFVGFYALSILLRFLTDFYLEEATENTNTGQTRGLFLTLISLGWLLSPLIAAALLESGGYRLLYIVTGLIFMPVGLLVIKHPFKSFRASDSNQHQRERWWRTLMRLVKNQDAKNNNLKNILLLDLWLNIFYAVMVVYLPLFLHQYIGLSWPAIGIIFTWMLLPFVLLDYPLGWLADKKWGEKEILVAGLIIAGLATLIIPWLNLPHILAWSVLLFITRVGAASVEVMKETYLFKKIGPADVDILSLSRNLIPLSFLIATLLATLILIFLPIHFLFAALGLSALLMIPIAQKLTDTK